MKLPLVLLLLASVLGGCSRNLNQPQTMIMEVRGGGVPPRPASATYPNWEQYCGATYARGHEEELNQHLRASGQQGWELVSVSSDTYGDVLFCFKRPLPVGAAPAAPPTSPSTSPSTSPPAAAQP